MRVQVGINLLDAETVSGLRVQPALHGSMPFGAHFAKRDVEGELRDKNRSATAQRARMWQTVDSDDEPKAMPPAAGGDTGEQSTTAAAEQSVEAARLAAARSQSRRNLVGAALVASFVGSIFAYSIFAVGSDDAAITEAEVHAFRLAREKQRRESAQRGD